MGYGLMVYSVSIDKLTGLYESGNDAVRRSISGRFRERITRLNNEFDLSNERGEPSIFEAVRHIIMGGEKTLPGFAYGYGLECIVDFYGRSLRNEPFYTCDFGWLREDIGGQLRATGAAVDMDDLLFRKPVPLPDPDDFPVYGYWSAEAVAGSVERLQAAPNRSEELDTILEWCTFALGRNEGVVGYYY
jgi:hypothetical protein